jgi:hypothetical protein
MGLSSSKTKTSSTASSTPLDQYSPYISQGLSTAQGVLNNNQQNMQDLSGKAMEVANGFSAPNASLGSIYTGHDPSQATYTKLQQAGANDPSLGILSGLANGPNNNPAMDLLSGMANGQVNGDTSQYYKDAIGGKFLANNPYIDTIAQQATDAATKAANQRFAASGMGEGMSTPYTQALGSSVADANNNLRYQNYTTERGLQQAAAGMSDSMYNATGDRNLTAANDLGGQYNTAQAQKLAAAQAFGSQNTADNNTSLNAANSSVQSILSALGLVPGMANAQTGALGAAAQIPYTGVNAYANIVNGLTGKYGNQTGTSTSTTSGNIGQMVGGLAGSALSGWATGGFK